MLRAVYLERPVEVFAELNFRLLVVPPSSMESRSGPQLPEGCRTVQRKWTGTTRLHLPCHAFTCAGPSTSLFCPAFNINFNAVCTMQSGTADRSWCWVWTGPKTTTGSSGRWTVGSVVWYFGIVSRSFSGSDATYNYHRLRQGWTWGVPEVVCNRKWLGSTSLLVQFGFGLTLANQDVKQSISPSPRYRTEGRS